MYIYIYIYIHNYMCIYIHIFHLCKHTHTKPRKHAPQHRALVPVWCADFLKCLLLIRVVDEHMYCHTSTLVAWVRREFVMFSFSNLRE